MINVDQFKGLVAARGGIARPNLFQVDLPQFEGSTGSELNLLCRNVVLPGQQIATYDMMYGNSVQKVAYGSVTDDVTFSFLVLNDYGVKKYFEMWQDLAYNKTTYEIGYKNEYARQVAVHQLDKGISFPIFNRGFNTSGIPSNILNRLPNLGLIDFSQGEIDIDFELPSRKIYTCTLEKAWPTTIESIQLNNELDGLIELNVQLSYSRWLPTHY